MTLGPRTDRLGVWVLSVKDLRVRATNRLFLGPLWGREEGGPGAELHIRRQYPDPLGGSKNWIPYIVTSNMFLGDLIFRSLWGSGYAKGTMAFQILSPF